MTYDSLWDTITHIQTVQTLLADIERELAIRAIFHDKSKLFFPEKEIYDEFTPKLKETTYGSDEYKAYLVEMGEALKHHYDNNRHHPEHFELGINEMTLIDLIEMLCDWMAASLRHSDGNMTKSLEINRNRFNIEDQLYNVFRNTIREMKWE